MARFAVQLKREISADEQGVDEYPSPIAEVEISNPGDATATRMIRIPHREFFRVRNILIRGEYALPARRKLDRPPVVVDVGANVGLFAIYMKFLYPDSIVHCYEPVPSTISLLRNNLAGLANVHIHPYALGREDGEKEIYLHSNNSGQNSIKRIDRARDYQSSLRITIRDSGGEVDALSEHVVDVLKIDTEGCELEILESLGERLNQIRHVLIEYHSDDDRRQIDGCLAQFSLFGAAGIHLNRGTMKYQNRRMA